MRDCSVTINNVFIAAYESQRRQVAYTVSKGGLISITLPIAHDLVYYGIRMVTIAPGVFEILILGRISPEVKQGLARNVPLLLRLVEFAKLAQYIVKKSYANGETIRLDGALRMS